MIHVKKDNSSAPMELTAADSKGQKELAKVIAHFTGPDKDVPFDGYTAYRQQQVKDTLKEIFHYKCAYCEISTINQSGDIEHFRPKAEIEELKETGNSKPGYYWLAATWDNLLLSCMHCNRKNRQTLLGIENNESIGKKSQFPLADERFRVRSHTQDIAQEEEVRLLIQPCIDNPEDYFTYDIDTGAIVAKETSEFVKNRALSSIHVYALHRAQLTHQRNKRIIEITRQIERVQREFHNIDNALSEAQKLAFEETFAKEYDILLEFIDPKTDFVGLARMLIGQFLEENFGMSLPSIVDGV